MQQKGWSRDWNKMARLCYGCNPCMLLMCSLPVQMREREKKKYMLLCRKERNHNWLSLPNSTYSISHRETLHCVFSTLHNVKKVKYILAVLKLPCHKTSYVCYKSNNTEQKERGGVWGYIKAAYQGAYLWQLGNVIGEKRSKLFLLQEWKSMSLLTVEEMPELKINIQ